METTSVNTTLLHYKNNIYRYQMLHVSTRNRHRKSGINKNEGSQMCSIFIKVNIVFSKKKKKQFVLTELIFFFKVCKSVHHRTIQINHQPDATIFQFIILTFIYSSTCFGRTAAHHQELNDCSSSPWLYLFS